MDLHFGCHQVTISAWVPDAGETLMVKVCPAAKSEGEAGSNGSQSNPHMGI
jgi:hypothetical protein